MTSLCSMGWEAAHAQRECIGWRICFDIAHAVIRFQRS